MTIDAVEDENFGDEEIGSNNMFKRGIEDAIKENRFITICEYAAFMNAIGALVPGFVIHSLPKLLFVNFHDSINATKQAIDFIKSHPSLPVSFDVNKGLGVLQEYLVRQETFAALQALDPEKSLFSDATWMRFRDCDLTEAAMSLAKAGRIEETHVLVHRHYGEVIGGLRALNLDPATGLVAIFRKLGDRETSLLIKFIESIFLPNIVDLGSLGDCLVQRARLIGESDPELSFMILSVLELVFFKTEDRFPLDEIKTHARLSQREELRGLTAPVVEILNILILAKKEFGIYPNESFSFSKLEADRGEVLRAAAVGILDSGELDMYLKFVGKFSIVDSDSVLREKIRGMKDDILNGYKRTCRSDYIEQEEIGMDEKFELMYTFLNLLKSHENRCECVYLVLTAVHSLNLLHDTKRFEEFAQIEIENGKTSESFESLEILKSYLAVLEVQKALVNFQEYSFIRDRPDFLMNRENVLFLVADLSAAGRLNTVKELAGVYPFYIDMEECALTTASSIIASLLFQKDFVADETELAELKNICVEYPQITDKIIEVILSEPVFDLSFTLIDCVQSVSSPSDLKLVEKLKLLRDDFGVSHSKQTFLEALSNWNCIGDFSSVFPPEETVEYFGKMERAKVLLLDHLEDKEDKREEDEIFLIGRSNDLFISHIVGLEEKIYCSVLKIGCDKLFRALREVVIPVHKVLVTTPRYRESQGESLWGETARKLSTSTDETILLGESVLQTCEELDEVFVIHLLKKKLIEIEKISDFSKLEVIFRLDEFLSSFVFPVNPSSSEVLLPPISGSTRCIATGQLAKRANWGKKLESFSIPFCRETLFSSIDNKANVKKILNEVFPQLVVKSGFDLQILREFAEDFGKPFDSILVKTLELSFTCGSSLEAKNRVLDAFFGDSISEKIFTYVLPSLKLNSDISFLSEKMFYRFQNAEWKRVSEISLIVSDVGAETSSLICGTKEERYRIIKELLTRAILKEEAEKTRKCLHLARLVLNSKSSLCNIISEIISRIINCPDLIISPSNPAESLIISIRECWEVDEIAKEKLFNDLLKAVPLSESLLKLANFFHQLVSDSDLKLLKTRLVLSNFDLLEKVERNIIENKSTSSIKKVIEYLFDNAESIPRIDELIPQLVPIHEELVAMEDIRIDIAKRWIEKSVISYDEENDLMELKIVKKITALLVPVKNHPERIIQMILKQFFSPKLALLNRLSCFYILFSLFSKTQILAVYNNPVEDLVEIQKNLLYLHLLSERNKVLKPLDYKDFVALDKCLVVRNLVHSGNPDMLLLACSVVVDFAITDYELIEKLEEKLKLVLGKEGLAKFRSMKTCMMRNGTWFRVACDEKLQS